MRTTFLFISASILLSSCIKTYTCKCEPTGINTQEAFEFEVKATKKAAEEGCESEYESSADYWDCNLQ